MPTLTKPSRPTSIPSQSEPRAEAAFTLIDQYAMDRIAYRVRCLCKAFSLNEQDAEDASQEMLTTLVVASPRFDAAKASTHTFVCRVLDLSALALARKLRTRDGHPAMNPLSFDEAFGEGCRECGRDDSGLFLADQTALRIDLEAALAPLPRRERLVAEDLKHFGCVTDVARSRSMARGSVYRSVTAIRERLVQSGIDE
jgi:DNA-directed RNA polymerase specialized sigma24 family protein